MYLLPRFFARGCSQRLSVRYPCSGARACFRRIECSPDVATVPLRFENCKMPRPRPSSNRLNHILSSRSLYSEHRTLSRCPTSEKGCHIEAIQLAECAHELGHDEFPAVQDSCSAPSPAVKMSHNISENGVKVTKSRWALLVWRMR